MTAQPLRVTTVRSTARIAAAAATSSPLSGSSSSSTSGSAASARAIATRWAWPPDSCRGFRSANCSASTSRSQRSAVSRCLAARETEHPAAAVRPEGDVGDDTHMREQQRVLQQQPHPSVVRRHVHSGRRIGQHPIAQPHHALVGAYQSGDDMQGRRFARAVGSEHREHLTRRHRKLHIQRAVCHDRAKLQLAHGYLAPFPVRLRAPTPSTTSAATTTSRIDNATAASASVTRCR